MSIHVERFLVGAWMAFHHIGMGAEMFALGQVTAALWHHHRAVDALHMMMAARVHLAGARAIADGGSL